MNKMKVEELERIVKEIKHEITEEEMPTVTFLRRLTPEKKREKREEVLSMGSAWGGGIAKLIESSDFLAAFIEAFKKQFIESFFDSFLRKMREGMEGEKSEDG